MGEAEDFDGMRPLVVAIHGAFAAHTPRFCDLKRVLPVAVVSGWLPGQGCPRLSKASVEAFAEAYSSAVEQFAGGRRLILCGESVGALVVLAMRLPGAVIALDPPLRTEKLWPLLAFFREQLAADPSQAELLETVLGVTAYGVQPRDYRGLLAREAHVIVGEAPLYPERPVGRATPSLVDEPERHEMAAHPFIRLTIAPNAGHVIPGNAPQLFIDAIREAMSPGSAGRPVLP